MMDRISSIIEIKSAYSTQVNLREEFGDHEVNLARMERYMPIRSHRSAFEQITRALLEPENKRFFLLTGSYGTGKSHLSLMLANYLSHPSTEPEIVTFFDNFHQMAKQDGQTLTEIDKWKLKRKNSKFLVCICDYDSDNSFMEIVLKSLITALDREGIDSTRLATPYREAVRKINEWKKLLDDGAKNFYSDFEYALAHKLPGTTVNQFIKALDKDLDTEKLTVFRQIHKEITTVDFTQDKNNLVEIVKDLVQSQFFQENFQGVAILFDEFDYVLKEKQRFGSTLNVFQAFGEYCAKSFINGTPVFMLATGHKSFSSHKSRYNAEDFKVVSNRIEEVSLQTEGFEDIISAIVIPNKDSELWRRHILSNRYVFDALTQSCTEHGIFKHLANSGKKLREKIIENIYPMHPMATHVLLEISKDIGSNNRSVFTFFTKSYRNSSEEGSYNWYTHTHDIVDSHGHLNFYTVDNLYRYFSQLITSDNTELPDSKKAIIRNFEASLKEWKTLLNAQQQTLFSNNDELLAESILQTLVLYHLSNVVQNTTNILFGLNANANLSPELVSKIKSILRHLVDKHVLFYNKQTDSYEFKKNDLIDIEGLVEDYLSTNDHDNFSVVKEITRIGKNREQHPELNQHFREDFYAGKAYNLVWSEDKRFLRILTTIKDLESKDFFEKLMLEMTEIRDYKATYEGVSVIVICETPEERDKAQSLAAVNKNRRVLIGIPRTELSVKENVATYLALESISTSDISEQEYALIQNKKNYQAKLIAEMLSQYSDQRKMYWYENDGNIIPVDTKDDYSAVSYALHQIYGEKRTRLKHPDLNKTHIIEKSGQNVLRDAVDRLLNFEAELTWDTSKAQDTADIRIYHQVLFEAKVLEVVEKNNNVTKGKFNANKEEYRETIPALAAMFDEIVKNERSVPTNNFFEIAKVYGVGQFAFLLYFTILLRFHETSLYLKVSNTSQDVLKIQSYSDLEDLLVKRKYPGAIIDIIDLTDVEKKCVISLFQIYETTVVMKNITIDQCYHKLINWYQSLPPISKVKTIYNDTRYHKLIDVFGSMKTTSMPNFILGKLQTIVGQEEGNLLVAPVVADMVDFLRSAKIEMTDAFRIVTKGIYEEVIKLYNPGKTGDYTQEAAKQALVNWYESLSDTQRDTGFNRHNADSKAVVKMAGACLNAEQTLTVEMPEHLLHQKLSDWTTDKTSDLIHKIRHAKTWVEQNVVGVEDPICIFPDYWVNVPEEAQSIYYFSKGNILIKSPGPNYTILYTDDGSDPIHTIGKAKKVNGEGTYTPLLDDFTLRMVSVDDHGRNGIVRTYKFRAQKLMFQARPIVKSGQGVADFASDTPVSEPEESLMIPSIPYDNNTLEICMNSIIQTAITKKKLSRQEAREALSAMLRRLEE